MWGNNSLGHLVWRWQEVRAGDSRRGRECVCFWLVGMKGFTPTCSRWVDRITDFLRAVHGLDAYRANHRFGCGKQGALISLYHCCQ